MTNITKLYQQLQEGKTTREYFVREARRQFPQFISPVSSFKDIVTILKGKRLVSESLTKEVSGAFFDAPPAPKDEIEEDLNTEELEEEEEEQLNEAHKLDTEQILDRMSPYAVKKGVEVELKKEKVVDKDTINKVKTRVAKKLQKNKDAYSDQVVSNVKEVEKQDKELETKEVTQELVDKKNAMRKPKGFKADKANTRASKKENKKGKPKGVKVMPDKGVTGSEKVLKEEEEYVKPRPKPLYSPEEQEADEFDYLKSKVKKWYLDNAAEEKPKSIYDPEYDPESIYGASEKDKEFIAKVNASKDKEELKSVFMTILRPSAGPLLKSMGLEEKEEVTKEDVLEHIKNYINENIAREYHVGMEVLTPDGPGIVKEVVGGTLTIEMMQGDVRDYQFNVINKTMDKAKEPEQQIQQPQIDTDKAARDTAFAKLPNLGSVRGKDSGPLSKMYKSMTFEQKLKLVIEKVTAIKDEAKKAKVMEMVDAITAKNATGQDITLNVVPSGKGAAMANDLKTKGAKSVKVTKIQ